MLRLSYSASSNEVNRIRSDLLRRRSTKHSE